jgi:hypothetical protein
MALFSSNPGRLVAVVGSTRPVVLLEEGGQ